MKGNGNGYPSFFHVLLHDPVAAPLTDGMNPSCSRILQISVPERTRSLPNKHLDLGYKYFALKSPGNL